MAGCAEDDGTARAKGRAKVTDRRAGDLLECVAGASELLSHARGRGDGQVGMGPGVVADQVPRGVDAADQRGLASA